MDYLEGSQANTTADAERFAILTRFYCSCYHVQLQHKIGWMVIPFVNSHNFVTFTPIFSGIVFIYLEAYHDLGSPKCK